MRGASVKDDVVVLIDAFMIQILYLVQYLANILYSS